MKGGSGFNTIYDSLDLLDNHWIVMDHGLLWPRLQLVIIVTWWFNTQSR